MVRDIFQKIFKLEFEMQNAISGYISGYIEARNPDKDTHDKEPYDKKLVFDSPGEGDEFRSQIDPLIAEIENFLKPKLKL
jgi:hypothetical protein